MDNVSPSSRALAFAYALSLSAEDGVLRADRREVESLTGMDHTRWPEAEAKALGVYLVDRGSSQWTDGHAMAGTWVCQFAPIREWVSASSASSSTVLDTGRGVLSHSDGGEVAHPSSAVWDRLGGQRYEGWRLHLVLGYEDVPMSIKDLDWLPVRTGRRLLARLREVGYLVDGVWQGRKIARLVEGLGEDAMYRVKRAQDRAAAERAANWRTLSDRIEIGARAFLANLEALETVPEDLVVYVGDLEACRRLYAREPVTINEGLAALVVAIR